jgi:hypothetical protein
VRDNTSFGSNPARRKIVIAALAACVALPTLFVLTHGNAKPNPQPFAPPAGAQAAAPSQPKTQTVSHHPIETFQVFAPRDPFEPVVISGGATGSGTSSTSSSTPSPGTSTTTDTSGSSNSDGSTAVSGHRIKLIDTFPQGGGEKARIQVDDTVYTVAPGETFATNFKLLSIQNKCITAFFGDDQFSLCEGEEILK